VRSRTHELFETLARLLSDHADNHPLEWRYSGHSYTDKPIVIGDDPPKLEIGDIAVRMRLPPDLQTHLTYFAPDGNVPEDLEILLADKYELRVFMETSPRKDPWVLLTTIADPATL
jgi:hypothetical protein